MAIETDLSGQDRNALGGVATERSHHGSPGGDNGKWIDLHHHILPAEYIDKLAKIGVTGVADHTFPKKWSAQKSIDIMDHIGVQAAITSLSAPGVYFKNDQFSRSLARFCNEYSAKLVSDHPTRFGALGSLPLPDVDGSLRELEYALDTLKLDGLILLSNVQGKYLGDPDYEEIFQELNRRRTVVFIHPAFSSPMDDDLTEMDLTPALIEVPFDTTRAVAHLLYSGVLDRYPNIRFTLAHAGGTVPYLAWKIALIYYAQRDKKHFVQAMYDFVLTKRGPNPGIDALRRLYYDTAIAANPFTFGSLRELVDPDHIVFGTDSPWAKKWMIDLFTKGLKERCGLETKDLQAIGRSNALQLFPDLALRIGQEVVRH